MSFSDVLNFRINFSALFIFVFDLINDIFYILIYGLIHLELWRLLLERLEYHFSIEQVLNLKKCEPYTALLNTSFTSL